MKERLVFLASSEADHFESPEPLPCQVLNARAGWDRTEFKHGHAPLKLAVFREGVHSAFPASLPIRETLSMHLLTCLWRILFPHRTRCDDSAAHAQRQQAWRSGAGADGLEEQARH